MFRILFSLIIFASWFSSSFATGVPFTDVKESDVYYSAVKKLYDAGVVTNAGDNLFRPSALMTRDFYVSLAVGIGCKQCITPSGEDIIRYDSSPFVDLAKQNPYYYCIAYAAEQNITQGYILDGRGQTTCENNQTYTTPPFCTENTITRIEAAAILLRRANLWNDTLNSTNTDKTLEITDVSSYWYGYARKGIEAGILTLKNNKTIGQDEKITRGEFALMAAKILDYTQCPKPNTQNTVEGAIRIVDARDVIIPKSSFEKGEYFDLIPETSTGTSWIYTWKATHVQSKKVLSGSGYRLSGTLFDVGPWMVTLSIIDPVSKKVVSEPQATLVVYEKTSALLSVELTATPLVSLLGAPIQFLPTVMNAPANAIYQWNFADGNLGNSPGVTNHTYETPGVYTVTLTVTNPSTGNTGQARVIIRVIGERDTDGDGVFDSNDLCPFVYGEKDNRGCPRLSEGNWGNIIQRQYTPTPRQNPNDIDGDGVRDSDDLCIRVPGLRENRGCPSLSVISGIGVNICLANKAQTQGLMIGTPACTQCPCYNTLTINAMLRSCDTIFPTILSPEKNTVYSRGGFFLIP